MLLEEEQGVSSILKVGLMFVRRYYKTIVLIFFKIWANFLLENKLLIFSSIFLLFL